MQVLCENCNAAVAAEDLDLGRNLAKCAACGNVFNCADQLDGVASSGELSVEREEVAMPKGIRVFRRGDAMRIVLKWFGPTAIFLAIFCLIWNGFMVVWFGIAITQKQWMMAAFGSIHALVGLGVAYGTLAMFLNSTTITVMNSLIQIAIGPIKVPGNKQFKADLLQQLYTKRHVSHSKNGTSINYELRVTTTDGRDEKLMGGFNKQEQALFIEQEIEKFLGIEDRPIRGEVER